MKKPALTPEERARIIAELAAFAEADTVYKTAKKRLVSGIRKAASADYCEYGLRRVAPDIITVFVEGE